MKPLARSVLGTFAISLLCTSAGIIVGMWMERESRVSTTEIKCADTRCVKRTAESRCGGPGTYQLLHEEVAGQQKRFTFICVTAETI